MDKPENQSGSETRHGGGMLRWVWITGLVLVLYVLSIGPVEKFRSERSPPMRHGARDYFMDFTDVVYFPLREVAIHSPFLLRAYRWYVLDVWHVRPRVEVTI